MGAVVSAVAGPLCGMIGTIMTKSGRQVEYKSDPAVYQSLQELMAHNRELRISFENAAAEISKTQDELQRLQADMEDPEKFLENEERLFSKMLKKVPQVPNVIVENTVNLAFAAKVSAGKSSALNAYLGAKVAETGAGPTTTSTNKVGEDTHDGVKLALYDIPGDDQHCNYMDMKIIRFFATMHIFVILYDDTPINNSRLIRLLMAMGKQIIFARNKLDIIGEDERPWTEELERDRAFITNDTGLQNPCVFGISARNVTIVSKLAASADPTEIARYPIFQWPQFVTTIKETAHEMYLRNT